MYVHSPPDSGFSIPVIQYFVQNSLLQRWRVHTISQILRGKCPKVPLRNKSHNSVNCVNYVQKERERVHAVYPDWRGRATHPESSHFRSLPPALPPPLIRTWLILSAVGGGGGFTITSIFTWLKSIRIGKSEDTWQLKRTFWKITNPKDSVLYRGWRWVRWRKPKIFLN